MLSDDRLTEALRAEAAAFADLVRDADQTVPVPSCPEWTLGFLVKHVGTAHRWAATIIERRASTAVSFREVGDRTPPADPAGRVDWLVAGADRLAGAVHAVGPRTPVWSWAADHSAGFWLRRMVHETAVHRYDAAAAVDLPYRLAADVAVDGIDEWLGILSGSGSGTGSGPAEGGRTQLSGHGETLHFHVTESDLDGEWLVRRDPTRLALERGHVKADVAVRGPAADLFMVLMRRIPPTDPRVEVVGDADLLTDWLANTAF